VPLSKEEVINIIERLNRFDGNTSDAAIRSFLCECVVIGLDGFQLGNTDGCLEKSNDDIYKKIERAERAFAKARRQS